MRDAHKVRIMRIMLLMRWLIVLVLMSGLIVACQKQSIINATQTGMPPMASSITFTPQITQTNTDNLFIVPTDVLVEISDGITPTPELGVDQPSAAPDPLRFVFPESGQEPVSAWRPPLYDVPWVPTPYDHFYFTRPIAANEVNWPLADYRYGAVFFDNVVHTGVDIDAPKGTPVIAAGDGKIVWAGYGLYGGDTNDLSDPYGKAVVIRHDFGYQNQQLFTVYGHLDRIDVLRGQHVKLGQQLGKVGETGKVTGPHLHFEVRVGESNFFKTLNPELWLVPPQGWGVLAMRIMGTGGQPLYFKKIFVQNIESDHIWRARSYAEGPVNSDPYYQENLVISDLPAGKYVTSTSYAGRLYEIDFEVFPGRVTYLSFKGRNGFSSELPPPLGVDFQP
ncbi:MAG TPA: M23 family metallopeptidase [Anaerolineae bacterium]|nr:M23 family metallopeptidase [Anaerolineae bacterium]